MTSLPDANADGRFGLHQASDVIQLDADSVPSSSPPPAVPNEQPSITSPVAPAKAEISSPAPAAAQSVNHDVKPVESDKGLKTKVNFWNKIAGSSDTKKDKKKDKKPRKDDKKESKKDKKAKKESKKDKRAPRKTTNPPPAPASVTSTPAPAASSSNLAKTPIPLRPVDDDPEPQSPQETFPGIPMHVYKPKVDESERSQASSKVGGGSQQPQPKGTPAAGKPSVLSRALSIFSPNKNKVNQTPASHSQTAPAPAQTPAPAATPSVAATPAPPAHTPSRAPPPRTPSMLSAYHLANPPPPPPAGTTTSTSGPFMSGSDAPRTSQRILAAENDARDTTSPVLEAASLPSQPAPLDLSNSNSTPTAAQLAAALDRSIADAETRQSTQVDGGLQKLALELNQDALDKGKQQVQRTSARRLWDMKTEMNKAEGVVELQRFLTSKDLQGLIPLFAPKEVTYQQLLKMNEDQLKELRVPVLQRRRLLFEISEENNRNFLLKQDTVAGSKTPHRTPRSARQSRDFVRQTDAIVKGPLQPLPVAAAGTAYVTPSGGHVSPRVRPVSKEKTGAILDYEEQIADLTKKKDEWKQRYMAQERRNRELEQYMHQHFDQFKQFLTQQEAEYNKLVSRLRDEGLPANNTLPAATAGGASSSTSNATSPHISSSVSAVPQPPAKEPVLEAGQEDHDPKRNSVLLNGKPAPSVSPHANSAPTLVNGSGIGSTLSSVSTTSGVTAASRIVDLRPPILTGSQASRPLPNTGSAPTLTSAPSPAQPTAAAPPIAQAASGPPAPESTAPRTRSTQNRNSLKRGSNSRAGNAAFQRIATGAQNLQHLERVRARCLFEYRAENQKELSFHAGDVVTILNQDQSGWWLAHHNGRSGFVPRNYLEVI